MFFNPKIVDKFDLAKQIEILMLIKISTKEAFALIAGFTVLTQKVLKFD